VEGYCADPTQVRGLGTLLYFISILFDVLYSDLRRNVPGQAVYLTSVQQVRNAIGRVVPSFALTKDAAGERLTTLVKLTPMGNLVAGAVTRTAIGFVVNPLTVVKVRYEVRARVGYCREACCLLTCPNGMVGHGEEWGVLNMWFAERLLRVQKRLLGPAIHGTRRASNALSRVQCDCATRCAVLRDVSDVL
jgi:hypothetical protein